MNIVVPQLGESVIEARIARWLKKEGDAVAAGDPLVELETDKIDLEVNAESAGVLSRIERKDGEDVKVGEVLGVIEEGPSSSSAAPRHANQANPLNAVQPAQRHPARLRQRRESHADREESGRRARRRSVESPRVRRRRPRDEGRRPEVRRIGAADPHTVQARLQHVQLRRSTRRPNLTQPDSTGPTRPTYANVRGRTQRRARADEQATAPPSPNGSSRRSTPRRC